jgi:hypothetical protein
MRERTTNAPDPAAHDGRPEGRDGNTTPAQGENQQPVPRMPHERDESADSQARMEPSNRRMGEKGQADVEAGRTDTTKGAELDATYDKLRESVPDGDKKFRP